MSKAIALLFAALPVASTALAEVQLLPAGEFVGRDGRPGNGLTWKLPDEAGRRLAAELNAKHRTVKFQFDYEHQTLLSETNGQAAPASGWATTFEWRDGQGLFATDVAWTRRAKAMVDEEEYMYISPVIVFDKKTGLITGLLNAALVGIPNLDMAPVTSAVERLNAQVFPQLSITQDPTMNAVLKALLLSLGLPETATEDQATAALSALRQQANHATALTSEVAALKAATPDATKWVPVERFNQVTTELNTLKASEAEVALNSVIDKAKADGKVVSETVEKVWRDIGKSDIAQLRALVDGTPANPALAGRQQSATLPKKPGEEGQAELSPEELAICSQMGISADDYRKSGAAA